MHKATRDTIIDLLLEDTQEAKKKLEILLDGDPYASLVYDEERTFLLIEKYLNKELKDCECIELDTLLIKNPSLQYEFKLRKQINNFIGKVSLEEKLNKIMENSEEENSLEIVTPESSRRRAQIKPFLRWVAAASVILLFSYTVSFSLRSNVSIEIEIFNSFYEPLADEATMNYVANSNALNDAKQKYHDSNYRDALLIFRKLPNTLDIQTEKNFFIGLSLMEIGSYNEAITAFISVIESETFECLPHTYWYLGLCYLRLREKEKAIDIFEYIVKSDGYNADSAKEILKKLM